MTGAAVKICGISTRAALAAAVDGGAALIGLVFYPPSPRSVAIADAAALAAAVPPRVERVGVFVDPDDSLLAEAAGRVALSALQLHGRESPRRVRDVRARFGLPAIKAIPVAGEDDLARAGEYAGAASPPASRRQAAPRSAPSRLRCRAHAPSLRLLRQAAPRGAPNRLDAEMAGLAPRPFIATRRRPSGPEAGDGTPATRRRRAGSAAGWA